jgi:dihydroorotate dehydrogenase (fumarate)
MTELKTHYLGLELKNPLVAAASALSKKTSTVKKMEDAGISAVVMYSLFEEQITHDSLAFNYYMERGTERFAESLDYFPNLDRYNVGPDGYLEHIRKNKEAVDIPVIASLNGVSNTGWVDYAEKMVQAGADALELNVYYIPTTPEITASEMEDNTVDLVKAVCAHVEVPVSVKLSPFYSALPNLAERLVDAGAKGLVLFNRFIQPDIDIENMEVDPTLHLSTSEELLLPLRWMALLYGRVKADLALTSGVHTGLDLVKAVMAGANVGMVASEFVANGVGRAAEMLAEMENWMTAYDHVSVEKMRGSMSQQHVKNPAAFERANYMKALQSYDNKLP